MNLVKPYKKIDILRFTRSRRGEEKLGEHVDCTKNEWEDDLKNSKAKFVVVGIPEDIGVRANYGRGGADTAYKPALESFLNLQNNSFLNGETIFVLGHIEVDDLMQKAVSLDTKNSTDVNELRHLVSLVDNRVADVIKKIIELGKMPIVIGGGHNNAFGNIKGASLALNKKINIINCDPHLDFRETEGRHSGNGFSYAFEQNYLNKYSVFAMHEQYNNNNTLQKFKSHPSQLFYISYETLFVKEEYTFNTALLRCIHFVNDTTCGIEIDLDAITNVPASAKTSSGISPLQARQYIYGCAKNLNTIYLHIAEGAPVLSHIKADNKTGKLIAYLMSDFMKAVLEKENQI